MAFAPEIAGPHRPETSTPPRRAGSVRRTTTIDTTRVEGMYGPTVSDARGRDLATGADGTATTLSETRLLVRADPSKAIADIAHQGSGHAAPSAFETLIGAPVAGGFRARVTAALSDDAQRGTITFALLDDLVGAILVAGVVPQYAETVAGPVAGPGRMTEALRERMAGFVEGQADICAGWARDASMLAEVHRTGVIPTPRGPLAPALERDDDPLSWHVYEALPPQSTRRRRRMDIGPEGTNGRAPFDAHFRDSHTDESGVETVVHEYSVRGRIDVGTRVVISIEGDARVLPWQECPQALDSTSRVVGMRLADLRRRIRAEFTGISTCTHLNDTLRSLADLDLLLDDCIAAS